MTKTICKITETKEGVKIKFRVDGKIFIKEMPFINYFYIKAEEFDQVSYLVMPKASDLKTVTDRNKEEYVRIYLRNNFHRNMLRNEIEDLGIETFEADINSSKRILIDNTNFDLNQEKLRIAFYDIESDDRLPFVKDIKGEIVPLTAITSIAVKEFIKNREVKIWYVRNEGIDGEEFDEYRTLRKEYIRLQHNELPTKEISIELKRQDKIVTDALWEGEKILLEKYRIHIKQFDIISAWNGRKFDDAYVRFRFKSHKMNYDDLWVNGFDYMESYKKNHFGSVKSYALNNVAYQELKSELNKDDSSLKYPDEIKKLDWRKTTDAIKYFDLFLLYPEIHKEYNIQDVQLLDMLERKLGFFKLHFVQCRKAHCLLIDTLYNSRICDIMILNESRKRNMLKISKPTEREIETRGNKNVPGGYTTSFGNRLYWDVMCFDFASHYARIISTWNISPENYIRTVVPDLSKIFTENEVLYIKWSVSVASKFIDKTNKLQKKKYEQALLEKSIELNVEDMEGLMWRFIRNYDNKIEVSENECYTSADINMNIRGWELHPHFIFGKKERAIYPTIIDGLSEERDKIKYSLNNYKKGSFEWQERFIYQNGLKLLSNSLYGFTGFKPSRDYKYEIPTGITSTARYLIKICMLEALDNNMEIILSDTDSTYLVGEKTKEFLDERFKKVLDYRILSFKTMEYKGKIHSVNFEWEETYDAVIPVKRKRYYFYKDGKVGGKGGYNVRTDTLKLTKDLQGELLNDIFTKKFDKENWKNKLLELKKKVFDHKLEEEHLIKISGLGRAIESYGKPVINGKTGLQKLRKSDGLPMFSPIPAVVKIAKRLLEEGQNVDVGTKLKYIVLKAKPKIEPITLKEYRKIKEYDALYYYDRIIRGVLEILRVTHKEDVYDYFRECWSFTDRQILGLKKKQGWEDGEEN